jgi:CubicO group peptidase (beta-lactamase class C family)/dienelactone hydrolase
MKQVVMTVAILVHSCVGIIHAQDFSKVDQLLRDSLHIIAGSGPLDAGGAALVLYKDGRIIHRFEAALPGKSYTTSRVVPIASASKALSGAIVARALMYEKITLDATVGEYFSSVTDPDKRSATLRQLMTFTSGWPGNIPGPTPCVEDVQYPGTLADCVQEVLKRDLRAKPGVIFDYGSDGMHIAGRMIELANRPGSPGVLWHYMVETYLTAPIGMTRTAFQLPPLYTTNNPRIDGGAFSSAEDYIKFCAMLMQRGVYNGKRILDARWIDTIFADHTRGAVIVYSPAAQYRHLDARLAQARYGLGWWRERWDSVTGQALEVTSQGAFGFSPWIDLERGYCGVLSIRSDLQAAYPTYFRMKQLIREAIDRWMDTVTYAVNVEQGAPSGRYRAGDTVHIWANPSTSTQVFSHWEGDTLGVPHEWHTVFLMPRKDLSLRATYSGDYLPMALENRDVRGVTVRKPMWRSAPRMIVGTRALIMLYHGTGGSGSSWFSGVEQREFILRAANRGFLCAAIDADEVTRGDQNGDGMLRWQVYPPVLAENLDGREVQSLHRDLLQMIPFSPRVPVFSVGMSNGGAFSASAAFMLGHRAAVSYCADGPDTVYAITGVPSMWNMARYDGHPEVSNAEAYENYQRVASRNVPAAFYVHDKQPLHANRLRRIPGVDEATALTIINELRVNGGLDDRDYVLYDDAEIAAFIARSPERFPVTTSLDEPTLRALRDQIRVVRADHEFYSDRTNATLDFIERFLHSSSTSDDGDASADSDAPWHYEATYDVLGRRVEGAPPPLRYRVEVRGRQRRVIAEVDPW